MYDPHTHSFVTKIWLEEPADEGGRAVWRGTITHVPSGTRRYLCRLDDIALFVTPYLERMGVKLTACWRLRQWLSRTKATGKSSK
jgi:hypothetical protein